MLYCCYYFVVASSGVFYGAGVGGLNEIFFFDFFLIF